MAVTLKAKIPFQPGLALGSIVRGDVIQQMEEYGQMMTQIENTQKEMRDLEQGAKILDSKIKTIQEKKQKGPLDGTLVELFKAQQTALQEQIKQLPEKLKKVAMAQLPSFMSLSTSLESPINFDETEVATDNRGFDSIQFSSQYIDMNESSQAIQDRMNQSSSASSVSLNGSYLLSSANVSHSWSSGAMNRIGEIKNQGYASKVLFINALVTTRHVRFFKKRTFDPQKLQAILDTMRSTNDPNALNSKGITVMNKTKQVYLLTEAVMGGSFSAIVTYLKEDTSNRDTKDRAKASSSTTSVGAKVNMGVWSVGGSVGDSRQKGSESHQDNTHNLGNTNIAIEFIAQGTIPKFAKENVVREIFKQQNQNLRKYESVSGEKTDQSVQVRQTELQQAMYTNLNSLPSITVQKDEVPLNSTQSVLKAYDDFCQEIVDDASCGIPIGFNYTQLTEQQIEALLGKSNGSTASTAASSTLPDSSE